MTLSRPPSPLRVTRLLLGVGLRRWSSRLGAGLRRRRARDAGSADAPRTGTARKSGHSAVWIGLFSVLFLLFASMMSFQTLHRLSQQFEPPRSWIQFEFRAWVGPAAQPQMVRAVGAISALLAVTVLLMTLGSANQDLGRVEWHMEWLFTFPASARVLLLSQLLQYAFATAVTWFIVGSFLGVTYWVSGYGAWGIPLAAASTAYVGVVLASVRLAAEVWLRRRFDRPALKNIQAMLTVLSLLLMLGLFSVIHGPRAAQAVADIAGAGGGWLVWNPLSLPAAVASGPGPAAAALAAMAITAAAVAWASVTLCQHLVRGGLVSHSGSFSVSRRRRDASLPAGRAGIIRGIVGKELHLLVRDRNFLAQTIVVPVLVIGFNLMINPAILRGASSDFRNAATLAFVVGAYTLMIGGTQVLAAEGQSLWLLYTLPMTIPAIMLRKVRLWCVLGLLYPSVVLTAAWLARPGAGWDGALHSLLAVVGVCLYAFIATGIGLLATDPFEQNLQRRLRPGMVNLYMLLAALYVFALYTPSLWQKAVTVVLVALVAAALWQKVNDRAAYLLDPTQEPPPRLAAADGLILLLLFFVLQSVILLGLLAAVQADGDIPSPGQVHVFSILSFAISGAAVLLLGGLWLWRRRIPHLRRLLGTRLRGAPRALRSGLGWGLAAAAWAAAYLLIASRIPALEPLLRGGEASAPSPGSRAFLWFALLAVVAAPLVEEFVFRGVLLAGLRRSLPLRWAVPASAVLFAIIHPPARFVAVFGLGMAAAAARVRTGSLLAAMTAHAVYNAAVVGLAALAHGVR